MRMMMMMQKALVVTMRTTMTKDADDNDNDSHQYDNYCGDDDDNDAYNNHSCHVFILRHITPSSQLSKSPHSRVIVPCATTLKFNACPIGVR